MRDVNFEEGELREYIRSLKLDDLFDQPVVQLMHQFEHATTFGSLIQPGLDEARIAFVRGALEDKDLGSRMFLRDTHFKVLRVLQQAGALAQRYHVVVANPPYMGSKGMNRLLKGFLQGKYDHYKSDLFSAFVARSLMLAIDQAYLGFMTPFVWMFISAYERLREKLIGTSTIVSLVQLEYSGFDGATVPICTFALRNGKQAGYRGAYIRLSDFKGSANQGPKALEAIANPDCGWFFRAVAEDFRKIVGSPIAYWVTPAALEAFSNLPQLGTFCPIEVGLQTSNNARFLRLWHEVGNETLGLCFGSDEEAEQSGKKWFPLEKGGEFRKWSGNRQVVVNWVKRGSEIKSFVAERYPYLKGNVDYVVKDRGLFFKTGVSWNKIMLSAFSARSNGPGLIFSDAGMKAITNEDEVHDAVVGFLNSKTATYFLDAFSQTMNTEKGSVEKLPFATLAFPPIHVREAIEIASRDWDNFETAWDFSDLPLLRQDLKEKTLAASWQNWKTQCDVTIHRMRELETENNRLFIAVYGLQDELTAEVPQDEITLARADARTDMAAFLSYAVGCMMGRYSLDQPGLILADAGDKLENYLAKVGRPMDHLTFTPDEDGIIPVLDDEWFEDDIVARTREFLSATFGKATLRENTAFIEESLGKDLRKYFLTDFYKNHISNERAYGYKKRPIYWLVQSPKKGFSVLIYLHRYTRDTMNLVLNRYLRPYQDKLRSRLAHLAQVQTNDGVSPRDKTAARKEADKLTKIVHECEEWERQTLLPLAQARIELDLDDGVKVNYQKLGEALAPIAGLAAGED